MTTQSDDRAFHVHTTDRFETGEEVMAEVHFTGLPGKMMVRAIGQSWHPARPRQRVRAAGSLLCTSAEWHKLQFLRDVAEGRVALPARRRHVRLPLLVEVRWRYPREPRRVSAALSEISEGGGLLLSTEKPRDGEIVVELIPPGAQRPMELLAVVRASRKNGVGLEFVTRDTSGVRRIREVIRRLAAH